MGQKMVAARFYRSDDSRQRCFVCAVSQIRFGQILKIDRSGDKIKAADVEEKPLEYSYKSGSAYVFMDMETYEQHEVLPDALGDAWKFLLEGMKCDVVFWNGQVISVEPPRHVDLIVEYCEPAARGNTATNVQKPAKMQTGCEVQVPAFINIGDVLKIDSRTGEYVERVSKA